MTKSGSGFCSHESGNKILYGLLKCSCNNISRSRAYLTTEAEYEKHDEEQDRPEIRQRHLHHRLWIGNKGQSLRAIDHFIDRHFHLLGQESKYREYHQAGENRRE